MTNKIYSLYQPVCITIENCIRFYGEIDGPLEFFALKKFEKSLRKSSELSTPSSTSAEKVDVKSDKVEATTIDVSATVEPQQLEFPTPVATEPLTDAATTKTVTKKCVGKVKKGHKIDFLELERRMRQLQGDSRFITKALRDLKIETLEEFASLPISFWPVFYTRGITPAVIYTLCQMVQQAGISTTRLYSKFNTEENEYLVMDISVGSYASLGIVPQDNKSGDKSVRSRLHKSVNKLIRFVRRGNWPQFENAYSNFLTQLSSRFVYNIAQPIYNTYGAEGGKDQLQSLVDQHLVTSNVLYRFNNYLDLHVKERPFVPRSSTPTENLVPEANTEVLKPAKSADVNAVEEHHWRLDLQSTKPLN